jgi:hypothetical protein
MCVEQDRRQSATVCVRLISTSQQTGLERAVLAQITQTQTQVCINVCVRVIDQHTH